MIIKVTMDELASFNAIMKSESIKRMIPESIKKDMETLQQKLEQSYYNKGTLV